MRTFSSSEAARQARVSERQLDTWVTAGYLVPEWNGSGPGSRRRWSIEEIDVAELLGVFSRLLRGGVLGTVAEAARGGTCFTLRDHDYEIAVEVRARRDGRQP